MYSFCFFLAFPKPKWECTLFDSYSESMPANQQPRDLNRMEVKDLQMLITLTSATDEALPKDISEDSATPKDSNSLKARPRSR
ncbi:RalBP1-associated Eps domain-containing protein 2 [Camelus dromedarius]|uniref:RalBP1-associated Eps domain-containing protein 2 n=1 Tax=Camelus dromedarius TaxID=9838 RepID=A0A5N4C3M0_CAMDR|nr:RalBP1-associated Eps domain-containing protein 2 [Camelus dromedarius]